MRGAALENENPPRRRKTYVEVVFVRRASDSSFLNASSTGGCKVRSRQDNQARTFEHEERDFSRSALRRTTYARDLDLVASYPASQPPKEDGQEDCNSATEIFKMPFFHLFTIVL
jgi:hypothetical protein